MNIFTDEDVRALAASYWPKDREPIIARLEKRAKASRAGLSSAVRAELVVALPQLADQHLSDTGPEPLARVIELVGADGWDEVIASWRVECSVKQKTKHERALMRPCEVARHAPSLATPALWDLLIEGWQKVSDRNGSIGAAIARAPHFESLIMRLAPGNWPRVMHIFADAAREGADVGFAMKQLVSAATRGNVHAASAALPQLLREGNVAAAKRLITPMSKLPAEGAVAQLVFAPLFDIDAVIAFLPAALAHKHAEVVAQAAALCTRLAIFDADISPLLAPLEKVLTSEGRASIDASNALGWLMRSKHHKRAEATLQKHLHDDKRIAINAAAGLALGYAHRDDLAAIDKLAASSATAKQGCILGLSTVASGRVWPYLSLDRGKDGRRSPPIPSLAAVAERLATLQKS